MSNKNKNSKLSGYLARGLTKILQKFEPNTSINSVNTVNYVISGQIPTKRMAIAVYRCIFDDMFTMTSAEKRIRRENTSDVLFVEYAMRLEFASV